jgi:hypothetical protein
MKKFTRVMLMILLSSAFIAYQSSAQSILCVDNDLDDGGAVYTDCWPMFQAALDANGYTYTYMEVDTVTYNGPDAATMEAYDIVIWWTGEAWTDSETLTIDDEFNILLYLQLSGGKLLLSAQDYLWDRYSAYGTFSKGEFPYDALGVVTVVQDEYHIELPDADTARFNGAPGSLAEGLSFPVRDIFTTDVTDDGLYADSIAEHLGTSLFTVVVPYISEGTPGLTYEGDGFRSIFTTLDIAAITDTDARDELMYRMVDWLMYGASGTGEGSFTSKEMLVSPNPAKDYVNIGMIEKMKELRLINSQGQVVYHQDVNNIKTRIDVSQLPTGIYIVQAITASGQSTTKMLVE